MIWIYHRVQDTRLDQIATISMAGTPENKSNKIRKGMERYNNEVAQDGVESSASLLWGGRLVSEVDKAARTCHERVKGMLLYLLYSVSVGMKSVLSNPSNKEIYEQIETNKSNNFT